MQPTLQQPTTKNSFTTFMMNPLIAKLGKINEKSEDCATYSGIAAKCLGFMLAIFLGAAGALLVQALDPVVIDAYGEVQHVAPVGIVLLLVSAVFFILMPLLAMFIRVTIPVTGTLYCAGTGYIFAFLAVMIEEYRGPILLAMILTAVIVAVMAVVYAKGWIKVDQKFRSILSILFGCTIVTSLLTGVCCFIPALKCVPDFLWSNPLAGIGGSVVYVVIASLFLLVDFDTIEQAVNRKLPRKYEWYASFGLAFSVIWLFLKLFQLIAKAKNSSNN